MSITLSKGRSVAIMAMAAVAAASLFEPTGAAGQTRTSVAPAVPIDPIEGILEAFKTHDVVALGEGGHGNEQGAAFRLALIRSPGFAAVVNDIVVESGNSLYQKLMDRFVSGESVPDGEIRQAWQNTTQPHAVWDVPIYEQFFRAVRDLNRTLPTDRKLRVWLGDPPVDWSKIRTGEDVMKAMGLGGGRDGFPVDVITREILAKGRRALLVYGDMHLLRKNLFWTFRNRKTAEKEAKRPVDTIVGLLEARGTKVFSIRTNTSTDLAVRQPDISSWRAPSLVVLRGTPLGQAPFSFYYPHEAFISVGGPPERVRVDPKRSPIMQDQFDAILYLGPPTSITWSRLSPALCSDAQYLAMRSKRMSLAAPPGTDSRADLEQMCRR
jgi:hypothetical protein